MANEYPLSVIIKAIDRISAPMRKISDTMQGVAAQARKMNADFRAAGSAIGVGQLTSQFNNLTGAIGRASSAGRQLFTRMALIGGVTAYAFKTQFIDANSAYEDLNTSLVTLEGSAEKAKASMDFVTNMSIKTPFNLMEIADTFRTMKGFGMDGKDGSLWALTEAMSALGKKGYDLQAVAVQLGQAWGKAKLQMQDIKPMIERGIPVWDLLAKASERAGKKLTAAQLMDMSSKGQLGRKAIQALLNEMAITYEGGNKRMMATWTGMMSNLQDYWMAFQRSIGQAGLFEYIKSKAQALLNWVDRNLQNGNLQRYAKQISDAFITAFEAVWAARHDIIAALASIRDGFVWISKAVGGAKGTILLLIGIMAGPFLLALTNLGIAVGGVVWAMRGLILNGFIAMLAPIGNFILALRAGYGAVAAFNLVIAMNPLAWFIGLIAAAVVSVIYLAYKIYENWGSIKQFFAEIWQSMTASVSGVGEWIISTFESVGDYVLGVFRAIGDALTWIGKKLGIVSDDAESAAARMEASVNRIKQTRGDMGAAGATLNASSAAAAKNGMFTPAQANVKVDFTNMPAGARVTQDPRNTANLDLGMGYAMQSGGGY